MKYLKKLIKAIGFKNAILSIRDIVLRLCGLNVLNEKKTIKFMEDYVVQQDAGNQLIIPQITNSNNDKQIIFKEKQVITDHTYVWEYKKERQNVWLSVNGSIVVQKNVLCTEGNFSFYRAIWKKDKRPVKTVPSIIVLFSQLQDGIMFGGYYDYVFLVAAKLCRIKDALPDTNVSETIISYPLFNTSYETHFLKLLDINSENLIDTRLVKPVSSHLIAGNAAFWYPNLSDILSLKRHIEKKFKPVKTKSNRIYISRSGRRKIINELELIVMLKKFDFVIMEDNERTITEQITIYRNASFIIGPHGASFSNIIWCEPGTHLFELFSPNYMPDFFPYLAGLMDMKYSAFYSGDANKSVAYLDGLVEDIQVSIPELEDCLQRVLE